VNLGRGWMRFDFRKAFGWPSASSTTAMQALGSYRARASCSSARHGWSRLVVEGFIHR
jgi:hypothetical protein